MSLSFPGVCVGTLTGLLLLSGCASPGEFSLFTGNDPSDTETASLTAATESTCQTPQQCAVQLRALVDDPKREWVGQPQSADGYADGTRLFAYRVLRKKLTCGELKRALDDTTSATALLQPVRYEKVRTLATAVSRELRAEHGKRCGTRQQT
jgi:hypothetical protein